MQRAGLNGRYQFGIWRAWMIERRAMTGRTIRSFLGAALAIAFAGPPAIADSAGPAAGAIAMHGEPALPPDFDHLPYVNPDAPQRRRAQSRLSRRLRQSEPLQRQGVVDGAGTHRQRLSVADDAVCRRAVHALRPHRQEHRNQCLRATKSSSISIRRPNSRTGRRSLRPMSCSRSICSKRRAAAAARRLFARQKHRRAG